ncbi:MAG: hypothetical protein IJQ12_02335 [Lachnospiraceae bacterium]|nr:hypothetical protein [Lachnospiraceae bacterium]
MWYVLQTKTHTEESALDKCRKALVPAAADAVFLPRYVRERKVHGVFERDLRVLFPGYLFVDSKTPEEIAAVMREIPGIAVPVCTGEDFTPVRREEQTFLLRLMDDDHIVQPSKGRILNGVVEVDEGPLTGHGDKIVYIDRHKRFCEIRVHMPDGEKKARVSLEITEKSLAV